MARQRAGLTGDLITDDDPRQGTRSFRATDLVTATYEGYDLVDDADDLDDLINDDDDAALSEGTAEDYYADAFEDQ